MLRIANHAQGVERPAAGPTPVLGSVVPALEPAVGRETDVRLPAVVVGVDVAVGVFVEDATSDVAVEVAVAVGVLVDVADGVLTGVLTGVFTGVLTGVNVWQTGSEGAPCQSLSKAWLRRC